MFILYLKLPLMFFLVKRQNIANPEFYSDLYGCICHLLGTAWAVGQCEHGVVKFQYLFTMNGYIVIAGSSYIKHAESRSFQRGTQIGDFLLCKC